MRAGIQGQTDLRVAQSLQGDARVPTFRHEMIEDIRYAVRALRKSRGATLVAILTIALAVGANTTIFSFIRATVLRPLPYRDADRMVFIGETWPNFTGFRPISRVDYLD